MKRNRLFLIIATLTGLALHTSCSQGQEDAMPRDEQSTDISFAVSVGPAATRGALTDVSTGTGYKFSDGDRVRIAVKGTAPRSTSWDYKTYKVNSTNAGVPYPSFTTLTLDTDVNTIPFSWYNTEENITLRAWSYGNSTNPSDDPLTTDFTLQTDQKANGYKELLYQQDTNYSYGNIQMTMNHELSRVVINLTYDKSGTNTVSDIRLGDGSMTIPTSARFDPSDAENIPLRWKSHGTQTPAIKPVEHTANTKYSAVLLPYTYGAGNFINIKIGTETFHYATTGFTMRPGKQYTFTINVKNQAISVTTSISDWGTDVADTGTGLIPPTDTNNGQYAPSKAKTTIPFATTSNIAVGDIVCSDGSIFDPTNAADVATEGKTPIGIIAYVNNEGDEGATTAIGDATTEKGRGRYDTKSRGRALVLCAMNVGGTAGNATVGETFLSGPTLGTLQQYENNTLASTQFYCGFAQTVMRNSNTYPAAQAAYNFSTIAAPETTTGWFLPSVGQWKKMLNYVAGIDTSDDKPLIHTLYTPFATYASNVNDKLNTLSTAGANIVNTIPTDVNSWYWTCSVYLIPTGYNGAVFYPASGVGCGGYDTAQLFYVRPVLAF